MHRLCCCLICLTLPVAALAQGEREKPILVLDTGGHTTPVQKVLFTPDGSQLITVGLDKTVRVWSVASGECLQVLRPPIGVSWRGQLLAAAISPDGKRLAVAGVGLVAPGDRPIYLISLAAGRMERVLRGHRDAVTALAFSPDGKRLASGSGDRTARLWDPDTAECLQTLEGHANGVFGVAFSPDGRRLATASGDRFARVWSVTTGKCEAVLAGHDRGVGCIAWSPDGRTLATGSWDGSLRLWDPDGTARKQFQDLGGGIDSLSFAPDAGHLLYTCGGPNMSDRKAAVLDLATGRDKVHFMHSDTVTHGSLSPDGSLAASVGGDHDWVYLWRVADGRLVRRFAGSGRAVYAAAWLNGNGSIGWGHDRRTGNLWKADISLERAFRLSDLEFDRDPVREDTGRAQLSRGGVRLEPVGNTGVAVKRDGVTTAQFKVRDGDLVRCATLLGTDRAVVGSEFGQYAFDTRTGKVVCNFWGEPAAVRAVAPSPDGRYVLSGCVDQVLRVWDPERDDPLLSLFVSGNDWVAWTPEGYYAASPGGEKLMGWQVNNGLDALGTFYPAEKFRRSLYRPDVIRRLLEAGSVEQALVLADRERGKASERAEVGKVLPPRVAITAPEKSGLRLTKPELEVRARATSVGEHPVTALRLLLDGRPYQGQSGFKKVPELRLGAVEETWAVQLVPGRHRLSVQADSAVSQGTSEEVEVLYVEEARPEVELPRLYVLAIGVSDYPGDLKLNYAAKDAQAVEQVFREKSRLMFQKVETRLLTDREATRGGVLKGLNWLRKEMTQRDVAVFFYAGHGQKDSDGRFYLLPVDVDTDNLVATAVADDDLKKMLAGMPGRVIALLDACHAGAVGGDKRRALSPLTDDLVRDLVTDDYGVVVMASAMGREFALESNQERHGCFTLALVEALSGKAANKEGVVYLTDLDAYVTERVKELTKGRQHPVTAKPTSVRSFPLARP
jgi:WD40 repeat protein